MAFSAGPLLTGPNNSAPPDADMQRTLDPLQQHINENLQEGSRVDYSDLIPPAVRDRPQPRGENK